MAGTLRSSLLFVAALTLLLLQGSCLAKDYVVGGPIGWKNTFDPKFYPNWVESNLPYDTGDTLDFEYKAGTDSVLLVNEDDYNTCNTMHPIWAWTDGPHPFALKGYSIVHFISGAPGHCDAGQKMTVETFNI